MAKVRESLDKNYRKLNKPFRTPDGPKKFSVYVKNDKGNVVKVNFGDPNMEIKRDSPERRNRFVLGISVLILGLSGRLGIGVVGCGLTNL